MNLNKRTGGSRSFVLVQLPEPLEGSPYESLSELCRDRVRRAQARFSTSSGSRPDNRAARGFRAYRLEAAALAGRPNIENEAASAGQLFAEAVPPSRDDEALLAELLLARGFDLTEHVTWLEVEAASVADVADGALLACFTRELTLELFEALVDLEPAQLILLEAGFGGNDEVKVNALQHLKNENAHRETPIELLVV